MPVDGLAKTPSMSIQEAFLAMLSSPLNSYQWACDECVQSKKATLANPKKQFYTFKNPWDTAIPYLAYFDKTFSCQQCSTDFVFSKEEQKHWYEKLQFVVYSKPIHCPSCRKEIRAQKNRNTELSTLLKDGQPNNVDQLERIAEIYDELGKTEKAKAYRNAANKLKKK